MVVLVFCSISHATIPDHVCDLVPNLMVELSICWPSHTHTDSLWSLDISGFFLHPDFYEESNFHKNQEDNSERQEWIIKFENVVQRNKITKDP